MTPYSQAYIRSFYWESGMKCGKGRKRGREKGSIEWTYGKRERKKRREERGKVRDGGVWRQRARER